MISRKRIWRWIKRINRSRKRESDKEVELTDRSVLTSAIWSPCGSRIYTGTNQGEIIIFDPLTRQVSSTTLYQSSLANDQVIHRLKIANATIRQIAFDSLGQ